MSYSTEIKNELLNAIPKERHCQLAEMAAIISFCGQVAEPPALEIVSENEAVQRKYFTLREKAFSIEADDITVLQELKACSGNAAGRDFRLNKVVNHVLLKNACCRRAYLRGAFICTGSMSDPQGGYHLEFVADSTVQACQVKGTMDGFGLEARLAQRKKNHVVYLKEGASIVDLLNVIGAHKTLLGLEILRVEKEVRNTVNRKVNCETSNIGKTVNAAARQIEDIARLKEQGGFAKLPDYLRETAELRLQHPEISFKELGELCKPPLSKSCVNHRLRKLSELAKQ
ncbi:MAG: DNA-binding protein WhiA [Lachnospiraceae bacterium]|jgi:DNA-binding protein WhiA|nr:DNA-binding protein WhiA [Lachnospiraceae bacterium]